MEEMMRKKFHIKSSIQKHAALFYREDLPYHNFDHALRVVEVGKMIVRNCQKEGVPVDEEVVEYALLFHDAGYHEDHKQKGFRTKEEYSASIAEEVLRQHGVDPLIIDQVKRAIISTHRDACFTTNEAKVVRAADLSGLASDYATFLENNRKLKEEAELLSGQKISWSQWKEATRNIVEFYLAQDIHLTSTYADRDGNSIFHKKTQANLERFLT